MKFLMREIMKIVPNEDLFLAFWCVLADVNSSSFTFIKCNAVKYGLV